jgi:tetratricopeptide (TPR) repeat protein
MSFYFRYFLLSLFILSTNSLFAQGIKTYQEAEQAFDQGDFQKALELYSFASENDTIKYPSRSAVGVCYYRLKQFDKALAEFDYCLNAGYDSVGMFLNKSSVYIDLFETEKAKEALENALKIQPDYPSAYCNRGIVHDMEENYTAAIKDYIRARELGMIEPLIYNNRGLSYTKNGDYRLAKKDFDQCLALDSLFPDVYANYGRLLENHLKEPDAAIQLLDYAVEKNIADAEVHAILGYIYHQKGVFEKADHHYSKNIELFPSSNGYFNRGSLRAYHEDHELALNDLSTAIEMDSLNSGALTNRALLVYDAMERYDEAIADLESALKIDSMAGAPIAFGYNNLGYFYYKSGDHQKGIRSIERSLELKPFNSYAFRNLALIYTDLEEYDKACQHAERAIELGFERLYGDEIIGIREKACLE